MENGDDQWEDVGDEKRAEHSFFVHTFGGTLELDDTQWEELEEDGGASSTAAAYLGHDDDLTIDIPAELAPASSSSANTGGGAGAAGGTDAAKPGKRKRTTEEARADASCDINLRRTHLLCLLASQQHASSIADDARLQAAVVHAVGPQPLSAFRLACSGGAPTLPALSALQTFFTFLFPLVGEESALSRCWPGYEPDWYTEPGVGVGAGAGDDYSLPTLLAVASSRTAEHRVRPVQQVLLWLALLRSVGEGGARCGPTPRLVQVHDPIAPGEARAWAQEWGRGRREGGSIGSKRRRDEGVGGRGGERAAARKGGAAHLRARLKLHNAGKLPASSSRRPLRAMPITSTHTQDVVALDDDGQEEEEGGVSRVVGGAGAGVVLQLQPTGGGGGVGLVTIGSSFKLPASRARNLPGLRSWVEVWAIAPALHGGEGTCGDGPRWVCSDPGRQTLDTPTLLESSRPISAPIMYAVACANERTGAQIGVLRDVTARYTRHASAVRALRMSHGTLGSALGSLGSLAWLAPLQARRAASQALRGRGRAGGGGGTPALPTPVFVLDHPSTRTEEALSLRMHGDVLLGTADPPRAHGMGWWDHALAACSMGATGRTGTGSEGAELASVSAAREAIPSREAEFKSHPQYALERLLGRYEVIHPRTGSVGVFKGVPVWPRAHVHALRSAAGWWRQEGREVRAGEVDRPVRVIPGEEAEAERVQAEARRARGRRKQGAGGAGLHMPRMDFGTGSFDALHTHGPDAVSTDSGAGGSALPPPDLSVRLYGLWQTQPASPPPVGRTDPIPVHPQYGRFELWHPALLPPGLAHVTCPGARKAALSLGISCAEAIVGFVRVGERVSADVQGVVVHEQEAGRVEEAAAAAQAESAAKAESRAAAEVERVERQARADAALHERLVAEYGGGGEE